MICGSRFCLRYDSTYTEAVVIQLWQKLLALVGNKWNVFAIDLKNEPHGQATWGYGNNATDWNTAAERMIRALAPSFKGLFFVEGVDANAVGSSTDAHFWGENLEGVRTKPIDTGDAALNKRVVYANHVYGPDVYNQPYFNTGNFPRNMAKIWTTHFGFAEKLTGTPIVLGEWGGHYAAGTKDDTWANALSEYLIANCLSDTFYWCLNPNGGDTGGLLGDDWKTVNVRKLELLRKTQPNPTKLT
ncbi:cellulase (glycosyl hydrolase family 5) subfamily protein, partial [Aphelenchoides avenae]